MSVMLFQTVIRDVIVSARFWPRAAVSNGLATLRKMMPDYNSFGRLQPNTISPTRNKGVRLQFRSI